MYALACGVYIYMCTQCGIYICAMRVWLGMCAMCMYVLCAYVYDMYACLQVCVVGNMCVFKNDINLVNLLI